ncbi:4'-phosphopantetheinyl transferase family protein [Planctobacterium marinum]|uniref:Enterobactin synthase component D n=1 Tax=Planctobacterium marinum TaxID=1631968 RepID=A0AA48KQ60_9ALTE|nr:hypothetical protein MACH26_02630 [Planctobacterium marinum]
MTQKKDPVRSQQITLDNHQLTLYFCDIPPDTNQQNEFIQANSHFLSPHLASAAPKRQAEFIAGRLASGKALEALGLRNQIVPSNADRSPQWPENVVGAISHKVNLATAAVSRQFDMLGLDLETTFTDATIQRISRKIINENEQRVLLASPLPYSFAFTQVFSAKETLYKAIYPFVRKYLGFDTSEVVDISENFVVLMLRKDVAKKTPCEALFKIHTIETEGHILTLTAQSSQR